MACQVLRDWLVLQDICIVDSAMCNTKLRTLWLDLLAAKELTMQQIVKPDFCGREWIAYRRVKFAGYCIVNDASWMSERDFLPHIGTHTEHLHLKGEEYLEFYVDDVGDYCTHLKVLKLTELTEEEVGVANLLQRNASTLETVVMKTTILPSLDIHAGSMPNLTSIDIEDPYLVTVDEIRVLLQGATRLKSLHLIGFPLSNDCLNAISAHTASLTSLWLNEISGFTAEALNSLLSSAQHLQEIDLGGGEVATDATIAVAVKSCPHLRALALAEASNLTDQSLFHIAEHCGGRLECLEIGGGSQQITDAGIQAIAKHCTNLVALRLARGEEGDELTDAAICSLFERCHQLAEVDLGNSDVDSALLSVIAQNLPKLTFLNIYYADGEGCVDGLAQVLLQCKSLRTLCIAERVLDWAGLAFKLLPELRPQLVVKHTCDSVRYWWTQHA